MGKDKVKKTKTPKLKTKALLKRSGRAWNPAKVLKSPRKKEAKNKDKKSKK